MFYDDMMYEGRDLTPDEQFAVDKKELKDSYLAIIKDLKEVENIEVVAMAIRGTKKVTIKQYNKDLIQAYEKSHLADEPIKPTITLNELYLDNEHYMELIEKYKFDEEKYIGVKNPPAIVLNVRKLNDFMSAPTYGKILNKNQDMLVTTDKEKIIIGDLVDAYDEKLEPVDDSYDGWDKIYIVYPESCLKDMTTYTIDIYVDNYKKVKDELNEILTKCDDNNVAISTPTESADDYEKEYEYKVDNLNSITLAIYVVAAGIILIMLLKKEKCEDKKE